MSFPANSQMKNEIKSFYQISKEELQNHVNYLANDKLEGREPGTEGHILAEIYVDSIFQNHNLKKICIDEKGNKSFYQNITIESLKIDEQTKVIISNSEHKNTFSFRDNFYLFHFGKLENENLKGEIVFLGNGIYEPDFQIDDYKDKSIKNKWIIINESISNNNLDLLPDSLQLKYKDIHVSSLIRSQAAFEKGAIGILIAPSEIGINYWNIREQAFRDYYTLPELKTPYRSSEIPIIMIDTTMYNTISSSPSSFTLELEKYITRERTINSNNVIGMVSGTQKDNESFIVIGAHLDHEGKKEGKIYNGADDNASGIAALLELSKSVWENPCRNNIVFVAFTAEEIGALGSYYFINNFPVKSDKIISMINLDMIGRLDGDAKELAIISPNYGKTELNEIIKNTREDYNEIDWEYMENFARKYSGDHFPFVLNNIPSVMIFSGIHPDYHQTTDDPGKIDYDFLFYNTKFTYNFLKKIDE